MSINNKVELPTSEEIKAGFDELNNSDVNGVRGVKVFDSGKSGPTLYVATCSHGNERVGAGLVVPLLKGAKNGGIDVIQGKVIVAVNNIGAANIGDSGKRVGEDGMNWNRLPPDLLDGRSTNTTATQSRLRAMQNAGLLDVTHGYDAHTIAVEANGFKLHIKGPRAFADGIGEEVYIVDIVKHQPDADGNPTVAFGNYLGGVDNDRVPVVEMEGGGPHSDPRVIKKLLNGLVATLGSLEMVDESITERYRGAQRTYPIEHYQLVPAGYTPDRQFGQFEVLPKGTVITRDKLTPCRPDVVTPADGHMIMPPTFGENGGDDWWISGPVQESTQEFIRAKGL